MASVRRNDETGPYEVTSGNFAAVDAYEPGSVAKVITVASALSEGLVTPDTYFEVPWRKQYDDDLLDRSPSSTRPSGCRSSQILIESSNIGTIMRAGDAWAATKHRDYMAAFGLGEKTALDFPGESAGILKEAEDLWGSERVTVAYGQGVSSTSLQLVAAINTIANDGVYVAPEARAVDRRRRRHDDRHAAVGIARQVVSTASGRARRTEMMRQVVCRGHRRPGPGRRACRRRQDRHGLQGRRQRHVLRRRTASASTTPASSASSRPRTRRSTVLVSVDEPPAGTDDRFGGTAAAPVFAELAPDAHPRTRDRADRRVDRLRAGLTR